MTTTTKSSGNDDIIICRDVHKWYGEFEALRGVSMTVKRGEVIVIIGPSGSGKSTFIRTLNRLEEHQEGDIIIDGITLSHDIRNIAEIRREVGMVFQQFNLFPHRSALDNVIEAPVHVLGQSRDEARSHATALLARVGLGDKLRHMPDMLSGGQQQRVAIARALAMKPEIILFDEPTSALDPRMAAEVEAVIVDLAASGQTMVVVTHSLRLARRTAQTLHVFERGRLLESGPAEQVFTAPRHDATRQFLYEADGK